MKRRWWGVSGLLLLLPVALLAGCAAGGAYPGVAPDVASLTDVPSSFYGNDPALRQWYTAPYWNPESP